MSGEHRELAGLRWHREQAELLEQTKRIALLPAFDELSSGKAVDGHSRHNDLLASKQATKRMISPHLDMHRLGGGMIYGISIAIFLSQSKGRRICT